MCVKVLIILLLFGVQLYSGQEVAKIELENGKEVYEIRETKNNSVEMINPKKDVPILREIIFYKVIEKPYIQETYDQTPSIVKSKDEQENSEPEFDETLRSFTNGHGLQFLDWGNHENTYDVENTTDLSENKNTKSNDNDSNVGESGESDVEDDDDKSDIDKNDNDQNDDDFNNDNDKNKPTFGKNTTNDKNDDMSGYDDDTEDSNKKQLNIENENIQNHDNCTGDGQNVNKTSVSEGVNVNDGDENGKTNVTKEDVNDKHSEADKIQEEELNLAKKLREQLLNSTKEKYHSVQRIHKTENKDRRKREVHYRNIPEAPRLPKLDVKSFPSYIQRMLANRPIFGNDEKPKTKNNYDLNLFDKMSGIFPSETASGEAKTYGFKYKQGQSTSWNGIHKTQNEHIHSNDLDLSGSQTNNPYEVQKPTIDIRDNIPEEDETLSKNKEKSYDSPKNIVPAQGIPVENDHFIIKKNTEIENQRNTDYDKENVNTNNMDTGFDIKNRLVDMLQSIDSKLLNGQKPRTYGMSLRGDKGEIWNDIVGAPLTNIDNTHNEDVFENDSRNSPNKINNLNYEKQDNVADHKDYAETNPMSEYDNEGNKFNNINDSTVVDSFNNDNKKELENYNKSNSDDESASGHEVNNEETTPFDVNLFNMPPPAPKLPDFNEQLITSTDKPKINYERVNKHQATGIPHFPDLSQTSTEKPIKVTEKTKFDEPEEENKYQPIDSESLRRKMEESFDNIIKQFPKLEPMKEETTGGDDIRKNEARNNNNKPRTYGMHLEGDHGYVWNDLTNPGTHVNVGELENIEVTEPSVDGLMPNSSIEESNYTESHSESPIETTTMEYEKHSDTSTNKKDEEITEEPMTTTTTAKTESIAEEKYNVTTEKTIYNELDAKKDCNCKNDTLTKENVESGNNKNETQPIKDTLDDLLKKDEFWEWLSNWTTTYMEVLNERVEKLVEDKIAKRLKNNDNNTNDENNKNDTVDPDKKYNKNDTIKIDKEKDNNDDDDDSTKHLSSDQLKTNNNNTNINDDGKEKLNSTQISSEKDINNSNNTGAATEKPDIKPEDIINSTNKDMSKKKNNTLPFDIKADTIYGNTIESDHVTNIFIFYPNVKLNKTVDQSEPLINKTNLATGKPANVTFDERIGIPENEIDNQINKPNTSTEISNGTQSNTESIIDVTSTSENPTTTEGFAKNISKEVEESKNENNHKQSNITKVDLKETAKVTEKLEDNNQTTQAPNINHNETTTDTTKPENNKETTKLSDKETAKKSNETESKNATTISDNEVTTESPKPENNKNTTINEKESTTNSSKKENEKSDDKETTTELSKTQNNGTTKVEDIKTTTPKSTNVTTTDKPEITTKSSIDKPSGSNTTESSTHLKDTSDVTSTEKSTNS